MNWNVISYYLDSPARIARTEQLWAAISDFLFEARICILVAIQERKYIWVDTTRIKLWFFPELIDEGIGKRHHITEDILIRR